MGDLGDTHFLFTQRVCRPLLNHKSVPMAKIKNRLNWLIDTGAGIGCLGIIGIFGWLLWICIEKLF
jgi:hypothetical protein